jgi:alpha-tubulin suppressor-like RCC1 family protein
MWKAATVILLFLASGCQSQQMATGRDYTCAITGTNGTLVVCFDGAGQSSLRRAAPTGFAQVSVPLASLNGRTSVCALTNSGQAVCFGWCAHGECSAPSSFITQLSVGDSHACAVMQTGTLSCWGCGGLNAQAGQCNATSGQFQQVSAGAVHTCALRLNGSLSCFGCRGALMWSALSFSLVSSNAGQCSPPDITFVHVSAGAWHTCGITAKGAVVCFGCGGDNDFGQCSSPSGVFTAVASGYVHTCVLNAAGVVQCFGCRGTASLSLDASQCTVPGFQVPQVQVSVGSRSSCSVGADAVVTCWGCDGSPPNGPCFFSGALISPFADLAMGSSAGAGAALSEDGFLVPLTTGIVTDPTVFNSPFMSVAASRTGICLLSAVGNLVCPCNGRVCRPPTGVFKQLSAGFNHMCALAVNGSVFCWGCDASTTARPCDAPSGVFKQVSAGVEQSCAILPDSRVTCWGCRDRTYNYSQCVVPAGVIGVTHVTTGSYDSCALFADGHSRCWTNNNFGQATPPAFPAFSFATLTTGYENTCGVLKSGSAKCWNPFISETAPGGQFKLVRPNLVSPGVGGILANGTMVFWGCSYSSNCLPIPLIVRQLCPPSKYRLGRQTLACPPGVYTSPFRGCSSQACGGPCLGGTYGTNCQSTCAAGFFCPSGSAVPTPCPVGRFSSISSASALETCSLCPTGSFCSTLAATAPTFCPAVSY